MTSVPHSGAKSVTPGGPVAGGHTAGPWTVDDRDLCSLVFSPSYAGRVAMCDQFTGRLGPDETERKANARLIAAAPEMLEALRGLLGNAEIARFHLQGTEEGMLVGSALFDTIQQARAAISKATAGETRNAEPIHRRDGDEG